jgi:hypothetical protein
MPIPGALVQAALVQIGRRHRRAETPDEMDEILRGHGLAPEHHEDMVQPRLV